MYFSESLLFIMYPAQFSDNLLQWEIIKNAIAGQTRYARNNPAGVKRSLYGVFRLFCNIIPAIRRFRHLLKLLSFQTSSLVEHLLSLSYRNFLNRICFILPKHAANIAKYIFSLLFLVYFLFAKYIFTYR